MERGPPSAITLNVYSGLQISSPSQAEVYLVMQCGSEKFTTAPQPKPNPKWSEACTFSIKQSHLLGSRPPEAVVLTLKEKDGGTVGSLTIPIATLPTEQTKKVWGKLESADGTEVHGKVSYDCWISEFGKVRRLSLMDAISPFKLPRSKDGGRQRPQTETFDTDGESDFMRKLSDRSSTKNSLAPITITRSDSSESSSRNSSFYREKDKEKDKSSEREKEKERGERDRGERSERERGDRGERDRGERGERERGERGERERGEREKGRESTNPVIVEDLVAPGCRPEVTGISPTTGPGEGGIIVTVRGSFLGKDLDDIVSLTVCDIDTTGTLTYFSPSMIKFVAKSCPTRRDRSGPIIITTKSGGEGVCELRFTYTAPYATTMAGNAPEVSGISPMYGPAGGGTPVRIFGSFLGTDKSDLISLTICGIEHKDTITTMTPRMIHCTTLSGNGSGSIVVITKTGGVGSSVVHYIYNRRLVMRSSEDDEPEDTEQNSPIVPEREPDKMSRLQLEAEVDHLRQQVKKLEERTSQQSEYIDRLVGKLLELDPTGSFFEHTNS